MIATQNYSITYNLNGGAATSENPTSYSDTDCGVTVSNPFKRGFVFCGWSVNGGAPKVNYKIKRGTKGNLTFEAVFKEDKTIIYNGKTVDLVPKTVRNYLESENKAEYLYKYHADYKPAENPETVKLAWTNAFGAKKFTLKFFSDEAMKKEILTATADEEGYDLYNPIPGKTY